MFYSDLGRSLLISATPLPEFSATTWTMAIAGLIIFIAASMFIFRRLKEAAKEDQIADEPYSFCPCLFPWEHACGSVDIAKVALQNKQHNIKLAYCFGYDSTEAPGYGEIDKYDR